MACSLLMLAGGASAADEPVCTPTPSAPVTSIAQLPAGAQAALQARGTVSDPGGPFNPGDVTDSAHPRPNRRLMHGQAGPDCITLAIEQGGIGHSYGLVVLQRVDGQWKVMGKVLRLAPPLAPSF